MVSPYFGVGILLWGGSQTLPPPDCQMRAMVAVAGIDAILLCGPFVNAPIMHPRTPPAGGSKTRPYVPIATFHVDIHCHRARLNYGGT